MANGIADGWGSRAAKEGTSFGQAGPVGLVSSRSRTKKNERQCSTKTDRWSKLWGHRSVLGHQADQTEGQRGKAVARHSSSC